MPGGVSGGRPLAGEFAFAGRLELIGDHRPGRAVVIRAISYAGVQMNEHRTAPDADGLFTFTLPDGAYEVRADAEGYIHSYTSVRPDICGPLLIRAYEDVPAPDTVVSWIRESAVPLHTLEAGSGTEDMQRLQAIVGDARVVACGEATHGTHEFFQMKHRILEFLVAEMGFTVFGIEAAWSESHFIDQYVCGAEVELAQVMGGLYGVWRTEEMLALIEWLRQYNADLAHTPKVRFRGFDTQLTAGTPSGLLGYLDRVDPECASQLEPVLRPLQVVNPWKVYQDMPDHLRRSTAAAIRDLAKSMDARREVYIRHSNQAAWSFARQQAIVLEQAIDQLDPPPGVAPGHVRDRQMAENVRWTLECERSGGRMMLWAHNFHVGELRRAYATASAVSGAPITMGGHLRRMLGPDYLAIGFLFDAGSFRARGRTPGSTEPGPFVAHALGRGPDSGVGAAFVRAGLQAGVLDLRALPQSGPVADWWRRPHSRRDVSAVFYDEEDANLAGVTGDVFDVLVFVNDTTPSRPWSTAATS